MRVPAARKSPCLIHRRTEHRIRDVALRPCHRKDVYLGSRVASTIRVYENDIGIDPFQCLIEAERLVIVERMGKVDGQ